MTSTTPEPSEEALGAAIIELDRARLPWPARWLLRDGTRARSVIADEVARRAEQRVTTRVREQTTQEVNASWEKALTKQAEAEASEPEPLPAFNSVLQCVKCGHRPLDPATRTKGYVRPRDGQPEAMQRHCTACGFSWLEAPADAQALSGPQSDENEPGDRMDPEAANGPHSTTQEAAQGHSPAERPADAHSDAETRQEVGSGGFTSDARSGAREASEGREEAEAVQGVGGDDA